MCLEVLMRIEDNKLARKLLDIRSEMNVVRAQCSWQEHEDMLDHVAFELEEEEELTGLIKGVTPEVVIKISVEEKFKTLLILSFKDKQKWSVAKLKF